MDYNDLFSMYYNEFLHGFGEKKIRKTIKTVHNFKHTRSLLQQCSEKRFASTATYLRQYILSNIKLAFANKSTELFAMALLLKKFNDEVNIDNQIISEQEVMYIFSNFNNTFTY